MEEDYRDTKSRVYKRRLLAFCPHAGSRLSHGRVACPLVMDGRGNSEGVRGIEVGIKLPVMPLANGTGEEVICHHNLLQSGPRKWGDGVEPGKDITRGESVKCILLAGHEECGKSWLVGLERMTIGEMGIWSCYTCRMVRGMAIVREQPWFIQLLRLQV